MPSRPKSLKLRPPSRKAWGTNRSAEQRGYGPEHRRLRKQVLAEEPLCRKCQAEGRTAATEVMDHIIPLSQGGRTERGNVQGLCTSCHDAKTALEAAHGRRLARR